MGKVAGRASENLYAGALGSRVLLVRSADSTRLLHSACWRWRCRLWRGAVSTAVAGGPRAGSTGLPRHTGARQRRLAGHATGLHLLRRSLRQSCDGADGWWTWPERGAACWRKRPALAAGEGETSRTI